MSDVPPPGLAEKWAAFLADKPPPEGGYDLEKMARLYESEASYLLRDTGVHTMAKTRVQAESIPDPEPVTAPEPEGEGMVPTPDEIGMIREHMAHWNEQPGRMSFHVPHSDPLVASLGVLSNLIQTQGETIRSQQARLTKLEGERDRLMESYSQAMKLAARLAGIPKSLIEDVSDEEVEKSREAADRTVAMARERGDL